MVAVAQKTVWVYLFSGDILDDIILYEYGIFIFENRALSVLFFEVRWSRNGLLSFHLPTDISDMIS